MEDVEFLTDVVIEATRAQGRLPADFDEEQWRTGYAKWTSEHVRGETPDSMTSVIELDDERVGRLRVTRTADYIELSGIQLLPRAQGHGIGTAIIEDLKAEATSAQVPLNIGVEKDNADAHRLYERLGLVQVDETEQEYKLQWRPQCDTRHAR
jgi:GNAT superfamily N-acetyltransferase